MNWNFMKKSRRAFTIIIEDLLSLIGGPPTSFEGLLKQGYKGNILVFKCMNTILSALTAVPWVVLDKKGNEIGEEKDNPLRNLWNRPNPVFDQKTFLKSVVAHLYMEGNGYIYINRISSGRVMDLWPLHPGSMEPKKNEDRLGEMVDYEYRSQRKVEHYKPEQIIHLKNIDYGDIYGKGFSVLSVGSDVIDADNESTKWNRKLLKNSIRHSGVFQTEGELTDEEYKRLKKEVRENLSGSEHAGDPLLLWGGLKWDKAGMTPKEMDWIRGMEMHMLKLALMFDIPPEIIGLQKYKTYSNYREARRSLYEDTIIPLLNIIKFGFNSKLSQYFDGDQLDYDITALPVFREDADSLWNRHTEAVNKGILKRNESRAELGYAPVPGGDELTVSANVVPLDLIIGGGDKVQE